MSSRPPVEAGHRSVLLQEAVESLALRADDVVVDGTLGGAGHARAIAERLSSKGVLVGVDADKDAIARAQIALAEAAPTVVLVNGNFRKLDALLRDNGIEFVDKVLLDLGWSSFQLTAGRGFSFLSDEPLSMAYAQEQKLTAETIVNDWAESSIADILFGWGEERYSRRIAERIVKERAGKRIETARELADIIKAAVPSAYRFGRLHPATKSFQALRIAVNDELGALEQGLEAAWSVLRPEGRFAVITFHSIEDRIVKRRFASWAQEKQGELVTRKPIAPSEEELAVNPRARSAKLRVIKKL